MAKGKGKSRRRVKDWRRRFHELGSEGFEARQGEPIHGRKVKLPAFRDEAEADGAGLSDRPRIDGMVVGLFPGGAVVRAGDRELMCSLAGTFRPPKGVSALAVGDEVVVALADPSHADGQLDKQRTDGAILRRQPRETALARLRPAGGKRRGRHGQVFERVVAANMEVLLIVASVKAPPLRPGMIDRLCIVADYGEMDSLVVINKIDLARPEEALVRAWTDGGIQVQCCSAVSGEGIEELAAALRGRRSILAGASGVGKSTLVNVLVPGADLAVRAVRRRDSRGRHVTAAATLHELPGGGMIVDTPGVRELALDMQAEEVAWYFPEIEAVAPRCRFNNCTHTHEPGCAVTAAVETGEIPRRRYRSYLRIFETL